MRMTGFSLLVLCTRPGLIRGGQANPALASYPPDAFSDVQLGELLREPAISLVYGAQINAANIEDYLGVEGPLDTDPGTPSGGLVISDLPGSISGSPLSGRRRRVMRTGTFEDRLTAELMAPRPNAPLPAVGLVPNDVVTEAMGAIDTALDPHTGTLAGPAVVADDAAAVLTTACDGVEQDLPPGTGITAADTVAAVVVPAAVARAARRVR